MAKLNQDVIKRLNFHAVEVIRVTSAMRRAKVAGVRYCHFDLPPGRSCSRGPAYLLNKRPYCVNHVLMTLDGHERTCAKIAP